MLCSDVVLFYGMLTRFAPIRPVSVLESMKEVTVMEERKLLENLKKRGCSERDVELAKTSEIVLLALSAGKMMRQKKHI